MCHTDVFPFHNHTRWPYLITSAKGKDSHTKVLFELKEKEKTLFPRAVFSQLVNGKAAFALQVFSVLREDRVCCNCCSRDKWLRVGWVCPRESPGWEIRAAGSSTWGFHFPGMAESAQGSQVLLELDLNRSNRGRAGSHPAGMVCVPLGGVRGESLMGKE